MFEGSTFVFKRAGNLFMVAVTRNNANAAMIFHFMTACVEIFRGYFNGKFDEETLRNNFSLVYELLDGAFWAGDMLALWSLSAVNVVHTSSAPCLDALRARRNFGLRLPPDNRTGHLEAVH